MDLGLKDKVALVAATSKGLGKAAAMSLAGEGCRVTMCARNTDVLAKAAEEVRQATGAQVPLDFCGKVLTVASCHFLDEPITRAIEEATGCRLKCLVCTLGAVRRYHKLRPAA